MRHRATLHLFSLFALALSPVALHAQFQEPTKEELQMTADPKAPGADAVYLYREETADDVLHYHSFYERIKVLTEKGKETATIRIPYPRRNFNISDIKGRTIHPDGTVVPLTARPTDLLDEKSPGHELNMMVFTLPSVEIGSILEYRLQIRYDDNRMLPPTWYLQQPYFTHKAHFQFKPSPSAYIVNGRGESLTRLMYLLRAGKDDHMLKDMQGRFSVDLVDIPPRANEDWMPPQNSVEWRAEFYYTQYTSGQEFWQQEGKRWVKEAEHFLEPGKEIKEVATTLVAATDTEDQKARKVYEAVQKLDNTDFSQKKTEAERKAEKLKAIKNVEDVWKQKSGSSDDLALLYVALARAAGLQAWPLQVVDRNRANFDPDYLYLEQLDDYLAIVKVGDTEITLDPGQKMCPFGILHWKHAMTSGLRNSDKGPEYSTTPSTMYTQNSVQRFGDLQVSADGSVSGLLRYVLTGQDALRWRQTALRNDEDEVKKRFNESIRNTMPDGVQADFDHFLALNDYNANLMAIVKVSGTLATATGKRFFLPGLFFESHARHPFVEQDKRTVPVDVHYAKTETDDVTYHFPDGYTIESAPQATDVPWAQHGKMLIRTKAEANKIEVARQLAYNFTLLDARDYAPLHDFYQKVATADQQPLVLTRSAVAAKGQ